MATHVGGLLIVFTGVAGLFLPAGVGWEPAAGMIGIGLMAGPICNRFSKGRWLAASAASRYFNSGSKSCGCLAIPRIMYAKIAMQALGGT
jgi:hypothetical protein